MKTITLNITQVDTATNTGRQRAAAYKPQFEGITHKKNYDLERHGGDWHEFERKQIDAVGAESALAAFMGLDDFTPLNGTFKDVADVGHNLEIKHTHRDNGNLIISSIDRDNDIAVLVTGSMPTFSIIGWRPVLECKQDKYRSEKISGDSYLIPRFELYPMHHLMMIGGRAVGYDQVRVQKV